ncbi:hypothetical protein D3C77_225820 [compost metagenome]
MYRLAGADLQGGDHLVDLFGRFLGAMGQVANLVGDYGKATTGFTCTGRLDGCVEGQQVGLLGDALDHIEDLADVTGAGVEGFDLRAGFADFLRQRGHRRDGFFHHLAAVVGLFAGAAGVLRGVGGVAGDFLGGGAQFVDRRGHAVGAQALLFGTDDRGIGGAHYLLRQVVYLAGGRRYFGNRGVNPLDELVEGTGQFTEFVLVLYYQAAGQVAFALGDVLHGTAHGGQRTHQHRDQQAEYAGNGGHGNEHGDDGRGTELADAGIGLVFVDGQADVPVCRWQAADRGKRDDPLFAAQGDVVNPRGYLQAAARVDVLEVFHHVVFVRADDHLAIAVDQEGMADTAEVHGIDDVDQGAQAQVATDHADQLTVGLALDRHGDGHYQPADGRHVGRGQHGLVGGYRCGVPGALAWVIAVRHPGVRALGKYAVGLAHISELEVPGERRLIDQPGEVGIGALVGDVLGEVFQHQDAAAHPVLHAAGRLGAGLLDRGLDVLPNGIALQVIVVKGEQRKCQNHDAAGAQQDLVAKFQVHVPRPCASEEECRAVLLASARTCSHGYRPQC